MRIVLACLTVLATFTATHAAEDDAVERLVATLLGDTPLVDDLRHLADEIGGRPTGSPANVASVAWGVERFRDAGVSVRKEAFEVPALWLERSATAEIRGDATFAVAVAAMPFSVATPPKGLKALLVDGGFGAEADFAALGTRARGAFVLVDTPPLTDVPGLFHEYTESSFIERRAFDAGVAGVAYVGSRSSSVLHRQNVMRGTKNDRPMVILERDAGKRALRLLREGKRLELLLKLDLQTGGPYESWNVIGEIRGSARPEEFVVIGAHLDSWGLGTGALDNGCNVAMVIDIARQMQRLGLVPRRTIRFALWNGEEIGLLGSWRYVQAHADELDRHVMASSYDIGSGRINGYFTGGRPEVLRAVEHALAPVEGLGPFQNLDVPIYGTDNFDFMIEGIGNLVANQESANYGIHYHADSDTFDKVDQRQLKLNAAVAAAVTWAFADMDVDWQRQDRAAIQQIIDEQGLKEQMEVFWAIDAWNDGTRGRSEGR